MRNNDVPEILFPKTILATGGKSVTDLKVGELGVFLESTGKSIAGAAAKEPFFIAVGIDPEGTGAVTDIRKSAGPNIKPVTFV